MFSLQSTCIATGLDEVIYGVQFSAMWARRYKGSEARSCLVSYKGKVVTVDVTKHRAVQRPRLD